MYLLTPQKVFTTAKVFGSNKECPVSLVDHIPVKAVNKCGDTHIFFCVKMEAGGQSCRWTGLNQILHYAML